MDKIKLSEKEIIENAVKQAKDFEKQKQEVEYLSRALGKILSENVDLTQEEYKELKKKVSSACDENGKAISVREMRKRIQENYYGTSISFLNSILGLMADMYEQILADHELLVQVIDKLDKKED